MAVSHAQPQRANIARCLSDDEGPTVCRPFVDLPAANYGLGTLLIVFKICETIWYGSPCEFGRRSSR